MLKQEQQEQQQQKQQEHQHQQHTDIHRHTQDQKAGHLELNFRVLKCDFFIYATALNIK